MPFREGLEYLPQEFIIAFPLSDHHQLSLLEEEGLSSKYNEFCKDKQVIAHYGLYWEK